MMGASRWACRALWLIAAAAAACAAGDSRVDPGDLELRDLLGIAPATAIRWAAAQRAAARRVLAAGLGEPGAGAGPAIATAGAPAIAAARAAGIDERVAASLAAADAVRAEAGAGAIALVRVAVQPGALSLTGQAAPAAAAVLDQRSPPGGLAGELWLVDRWRAEPRWGELPGRGLGVLAALAADAGHRDGPVVVVPVPALAAVAAFVAAGPDQPARLAVNPVLLAALEPAGEPDSELAGAVIAVAAPAGAERQAASGPGTGAALVAPAASASTGGNPYSFYGSVAECAFAQRTRCEACLAGRTCRPITDAPSGTTECEALAAESGRGYFLLCINLALAITSVERCTADAAPGCARDPGAAGSLTTLEANASFASDATCAGALDGCLAEIYGEPSEDYPGPDGGPPPGEPPRSTTVSCASSCSNDNSNCEASPSFDCTGPSCDNSLSCDSQCSSSNDQSGCGGNCDACSSSGDSGGGGCSDDAGTSDGGGCSSDGGGDGDGCSSDGGGGDAGCSSGCGSSGGGCSGDSCSGDSCGSSSCGSSSKCSIARAGPRRGPGSAGAGLAMSMTWAALPVVAAALVRRRVRRRRGGDCGAAPPGAMEDRS